MHDDEEFDQKALDAPSQRNPLEADEIELGEMFDRGEIETTEVDDDGNEQPIDDPFQ